METECEMCSYPSEREDIQSILKCSQQSPNLYRIYAIPDHMHALANMLGDGLVLQMLAVISLG